MHLVTVCVACLLVAAPVGNAFVTSDAAAAAAMARRMTSRPTVTATAVARRSAPRPLRARPADATDAEWEQIVEAEKASREKKFGPAAQAMEMFNKGMIEENQLRIWDELSRRRTTAPRATRRKAGAAGGAKKKKKKGFGAAAPAAPAAPPPPRDYNEGPLFADPLPPSPPSPPSPSSAPTADRGGAPVGAPPPAEPASKGLFGGFGENLKKLYDEADAMGYAQAIALSTDLENKGILPKVVTAEQPPPPAAAAARQEGGDGAAAATVATAASGGGAAGKKKKKAKRKK